jgi:hypothetical protein
VLTIIFSHELGMPVVHSYSFCESITNDLPTVSMFRVLSLSAAIPTKAWKLCG